MLKLISFGPPKVGKTVFTLSAAELGNIGVIDNEGRHQWYTTPAESSLTRRPFPFDNPRRLRMDLPMLQGNEELQRAFAASQAHLVYLVQTANLEKVQRAVEAWNADASLSSIVLDSGTNWWDVLTSTRDTSDEKMSMLSWGPIKEADRLFKIGLTAGGKNVIIVAHEKELLQRVPKPGGGHEFIKAGSAPRLERTSPHWADLVFRLDLPAGAPYPCLTVTDEGTGAAGGLKRGVQLDNPTFRRLMGRLGLAKLEALEGVKR